MTALAAAAMLGFAVVGAGGAAPPAVTLRVAVDVVGDSTDRAAFEAMVADVLADRRGWSAAGYRFAIDPEAAYRLVVALGSDIPGLCAPYQSRGKLGCTEGPTRAINAASWKSPPAWWTGERDPYRVFLVNHEVGHLIGLRLHLPCPRGGGPMPVMALYGRDITPCTLNAWPTPVELERAAAHPPPAPTGR